MIGSLLAVAVAVVLSPLGPIGPVRSVYPDRGIAADWTVLGLGLVVLVVGLGSIAAALAYRAAAARRPTGSEPQRPRRSAVAGAAASLGLPAPVVTGVRFALEPGTGRNAVPVRSAILGAALAVVVVVATITFSASLNTLVSHPRCTAGTGTPSWPPEAARGTSPAQHAQSLLDHDRSVASWSGAYAYDLSIDGQVTAVLGERPGASVQPPVLSGHGLRRPRAGRARCDHPGPTAQAPRPDRDGAGQSRSAPHTHDRGDRHHAHHRSGRGAPLEMGTGALLASDLIPAPDRDPFNDPAKGPEEIFVNFRPGVDTRSASASLNRIASQLSNTYNFGVFTSPPLRPAEIINYRSMGTTPAILGSALALGAVVALGLTLVASVRRRRRDLALLKTLGSTRRQLASVVAWQSSIAVLIGTVVGVPLGIVVGRVLWTVFADEIHAVPSPSVPVLTVAFVGLGALVLANVVAAIPGRIAARTPTALLLRAE